MRRLSITVMRLRMARPSGTWLMPSATILCGGRRTMLLPSKVDAAGGRADQAGDGLQQRRLAGAVRADQRDDLALRDVEGDVVQHLDLAVAGAQPSDR